MNTKLRNTVQALMVGASTLSTAQAGVNVQLFTPSTGNKYSLTENAMPDKPDGEAAKSYRRYMLGVNYSFLHDPLVSLNEARTARVATLIEGIQTMDITAGFDYSGYFSVNVGLPMHIVHRPGVAAAFTLGDTRLYSKIHVWRGELPFDLAFMPEVILPTGSQDLFVGNGTTALGFHLGFEYDFGLLSAAANVGFRHVLDGGGQFESMNYQNQIPLKLGIAIPVGQRWAINAEGQGILMVPWDRYQAPSEFYLGARYKVTDDMVASLGGSIGSFNGIASSDWRVIGGLKFAPTSKDLAPKVVQAAKPLPRVEFTAKAVIIREEVRFEHNSDVLTSSGKNLLDEVAKVLKENRTGFSQIVIEGHTNEIGSQKYNLVLSRKRANSVKEYLVSRGIESYLLTPVGYGKSRPKSLGKELSKMAKLEMDRRVEFKVVAPVKQAVKPVKKTPVTGLSPSQVQQRPKA
jgi:outer membrane protein OmpA-like peptidoglycan-associated protein